MHAKVEPVSDVSTNELRREKVLVLLQNPEATFRDIFKIFPVTVLAKICGLHTTAFQKKIETESEELIRLGEIQKIAAYFNLTPTAIFELVLKDMKPGKKSAGGKKKVAETAKKATGAKKAGGAGSKSGKK